MNWKEWSEINKINQYGVYYGNTNHGLKPTIKKFNPSNQEIDKLKSIVNQFMQLNAQGEVPQHFKVNKPGDATLLN